MTYQPRQTLTLELEIADEDCITGRLSDSSGHATDFIGWLGLAGAIESLSGGDSEAHEPGANSAGPHGAGPAIDEL